jgi:hypothetical protein
MTAPVFVGTCRQRLCFNVRYRVFHVGNCFRRAAAVAAVAVHISRFGSLGPSAVVTARQRLSRLLLRSADVLIQQAF